jgi:hypothetical protein
MSRLVATALVTIVAFAGGSLVAMATDGQRAAAAASRDADEVSSGLLTHDADGYRYVYQLVTGREALYDLRTDSRRIRNLADTDADRTREMRRALESRLGVFSLESLRARHAGTIRTLRTLGYL